MTEPSEPDASRSAGDEEWVKSVVSRALLAATSEADRTPLSATPATRPPSQWPELTPLDTSALRARAEAASRTVDRIDRPDATEGAHGSPLGEPAGGPSLQPVEPADVPGRLIEAIERIEQPDGVVTERADDASSESAVVTDPFGDLEALVPTLPDEPAVDPAVDPAGVATPGVAAPDLDPPDVGVAAPTVGGPGTESLRADDPMAQLDPAALAGSANDDAFESFFNPSPDTPGDAAPIVPPPVPFTDAASNAEATTGPIASHEPGRAASPDLAPYGIVGGPGPTDAVQPTPFPPYRSVNDEVMVETEATTEGYRTSDLRTVLEWIAVILSALVVALLIKAFVLQAFWIPSESMETTVNEGDRILVNKMSYRLHEVRRGDLVVFRKLEGAPGETNDLIKRAIALPGETIEVRSDGRIWIWGPGETEDDAKLLEEPYLDPQNAILAAPTGTEPVVSDIWNPACTNQPRTPGRCTLDDSSFFMMGDNRRRSSDSRFFGPVPEENIVGRAFVRIWPLGDISTL